MSDGIAENPLIQTDGLKKAWAEAAKDFMEDDDFSETLDLVVKIMAKPNVPPQQVGVLIVRLQAHAIKMRVMYGSYMSYLKGTDGASAKKNLYKYLYDGIENLVDALKYLVK